MLMIPHVLRPTFTDSEEAVLRAEILRQREHLLFGFGARCATPMNVVKPGFGSSAPRRVFYTVEGEA